MIAPCLTEQLVVLPHKRFPFFRFAAAFAKFFFTLSFTIRQFRRICGWPVCLAEMFKEEFSSPFDAAFDLGLSVWSGHEMAAFPALIEFDAVDIDASAGELAGKRDRVGGDLSLERSA